VGRRSAIILVLCLLVGCGAPPTATPDLVATQVAVEKAAAATLTAEAPPTVAQVVTNTPQPTSTPSPTSIPTATPSPSATWTSTPTATWTPSPTSTWTPSPTATIEPYDTWKKSARTDLTYKMVDKSDEYIGERVCWRGEIFSIEASSGMTFFQAWYFEGSSYSVFEDGSDAFVVNYLGDLPDIFDEDVVEACGLIGEKFEGTNAYGASIVQPQILGIYVSKFKPTPKPTAKPQPTKPPTPTPVLAKIGEQVKAGHWLFTVTGVQYHKALYLYDNSKVAMGVYCVIFLDMQNQASGTDYFGKQWWELRGANGGVFDDDSVTGYAAWQFAGLGTPWDDVNPGEWGKFVVAFDVSQEAKGLVLYSRKLNQALVYIGDAQPPQDQ
jgi:hypothetical protein